MTNLSENQKRKTFYYFSLRFVKVLMLLFTAMLFISGLLFMCYSTDMESQVVLYKWDNPFFTIFGTFILCVILFSITWFICKNAALSRLKILRVSVLLWCLLSGIVLIFFSKSVPAGDGYSVYSISENLATGNTSVIHPYESYISYYPQQIGLVAFWEILIRIWNITGIQLPAYHFIKLIYLVLECTIIIYQEKIVHILWKDEKAECLYLILAGLNCPLLIYTSFVYGEIPSFAAISFSIYFLTRLLAKEYHSVHPVWLAFGNVFFLTLSVMLRKNSLIFVIAIVAVILLYALWQKRPGLLLLSAFCIACSLSVLPCIQKYYELRSGNTISSGVTAISYFAMGMQESPRANGWYNGFNFDTYQNTGMDTAASNAISQEAIRERLAYFRENPGYAVNFYWKKYLSQWVDGTYACRQATLATFGGRSPFFVSLYEGEYSKYLVSYCNLYQNILYLGAFWFCLAALRRKTFGFQLLAYLELISAFGGFLFHMIWEANSRYIFLYALAMLPFTAKGLSMLGDTILDILRRRNILKSANNIDTKPAA